MRSLFDCSAAKSAVRSFLTVVSVACLGCATTTDEGSSDVANAHDALAADGAMPVSSSDSIEAPDVGLGDAPDAATGPDAESDPEDAIAADDSAESDVAGPPPECLVNADCAPYEDGNKCNGALRCHETLRRCVPLLGSVVNCEDSTDTVCAKSVCDPATGKCEVKPAPFGTPCVDADPCSVDSACVGGSCKAVGSANWCECDEDADCASKDDGDACNGILFCDKATFPAQCHVNLATVVTCSTKNDTVCSKSLCASQSGTCLPVAQPNGTVCGDGNPCTVSDVCQAGQCVGKQACACQSDADCAKKDDADACNGTLYCDKSVAGAHSCQVKPGSVPLCKGATAVCTVDTCEPKTGVCVTAPAKDGSACDDGQPCTASDTCKAAQCVPGKMVCQCIVDADCAAHEDGNACNGTLRCNSANGSCVVNKPTIVTCDTAKDTVCKVSACAPKTGACSLTPVESTQKFCATGGGGCRTEVVAAPSQVAKLCDDGDKCTNADSCKSGVCVSGVDVCECKSDVDCAAKDDGNKCNGSLKCDHSGALPKCVFDPASVVSCNTKADTACMTTNCQPKTGKCVKAAVANGTGCDDGDKCTSGDKCASGKCAGSGSCAPAWAEVYKKAFGAYNCGGCHTEYNGASVAYKTLISDSYCSAKLVIPGNPAGSAIVAKMGKGVPLTCGSKMPDGTTGIDDSALALLKEWIKAGAKQN